MGKLPGSHANAEYRELVLDMESFSSADEASKANFLRNYIVKTISGRISWRSETAHVEKSLFFSYVKCQLILLSVKFFYIL